MLYFGGFYHKCQDTGFFNWIFSNILLDAFEEYPSTIIPKNVMKMFSNNRYFMIFLQFSSLIFELCSIICIFFYTLPIVYLIFCIKFHLGIGLPCDIWFIGHFIALSSLAAEQTFIFEYSDLIIFMGLLYIVVYNIEFYPFSAHGFFTKEKFTLPFPMNAEEMIKCDPYVEKFPFHKDCIQIYVNDISVVQKIANYQLPLGWYVLENRYVNVYLPEMIRRNVFKMWNYDENQKFLFNENKFKNFCKIIKPMFGGKLNKNLKWELKLKTQKEESELSVNLISKCLI